MKSPTFMQISELCWPEDEAWFVIKMFYGLIEDESLDYAKEWLAREIKACQPMFEDAAFADRFTAHVERLAPITDSRVRSDEHYAYLEKICQVGA